MRLFILAAIFLCSCGSYAASFMPENDLHLQDSFANSNITEQVFNDQMQKARTVYAPIFKNLGLTLDLRGNWSDSTVNAYANRSGSTAQIRMFGGLARRAEITSDGFMAVICHEVGHHLGGYPYIEDWAAAEGQSDLFATRVCLRRIFTKYPSLEQTFLARGVNYKKWCSMVMNDDAKISICARSLIAGKSTADLLASLGGGQVRYETPDQTKVSQTNTSYPRTTQCRLDTYAYGALCDLDWNDGIIPDSEAQGKPSICYRPRCWFKSRT